MNLKDMTDEELKKWITALECQLEVVERFLDSAKDERISRGAKKAADAFASFFQGDIDRLNKLTILK